MASIVLTSPVSPESISSKTYSRILLAKLWKN